MDKPTVDKEAILKDVKISEGGLYTKKDVLEAMDTYSASLIKENEELKRRVIELQQADMTHEYNNAEAERVWPQIEQQIRDDERQKVLEQLKK